MQVVAGLRVRRRHEGSALDLNSCSNSNQSEGDRATSLQTQSTTIQKDQATDVTVAATIDTSRRCSRRTPHRWREKIDKCGKEREMEREVWGTAPASSSGGGSTVRRRRREREVAILAQATTTSSPLCAHAPLG